MRIELSRQVKLCSYTCLVCSWWTAPHNHLIVVVVNVVSALMNGKQCKCLLTHWNYFECNRRCSQRIFRTIQNYAICMFLFSLFSYAHAKQPQNRHRIEQQRLMCSWRCCDKVKCLRISNWCWSNERKSTSLTFQDYCDSVCLPA